MLKRKQSLLGLSMILLLAFVSCPVKHVIKSHFAAKEIPRSHQPVSAKAISFQNDISSSVCANASLTDAVTTSFPDYRNGVAMLTASIQTPVALHTDCLILFSASHYHPDTSEPPVYLRQKRLLI